VVSVSERCKRGPVQSGAGVFPNVFGAANRRSKYTESRSEPWIWFGAAVRVLWWQVHVYQAERTELSCRQASLSALMPLLRVIPCEYVAELYTAKKLEPVCYLPEKTASSYVHLFWHNTGVWRTGGRTDRNAVAKTVLSIATRCKMTSMWTFYSKINPQILAISSHDSIPQLYKVLWK